jgi:formate dehydrogenase subunit gamma
MKHSPFHVATGFVFVGAVLLLTVLWVKDALPATGDGKWLRHFGGYFGFRSKLPAGKLNAGQKLYFWFVLFVVFGLVATGAVIIRPSLSPGALSVAYTLHDVFAILAICGILAHIYLAVIANPVSLRGIIDGGVPASWAQEHHPDWVARRQEQAHD